MSSVLLLDLQNGVIFMISKNNFCVLTVSFV